MDRTFEVNKLIITRMGLFALYLQALIVAGALWENNALESEAASQYSMYYFVYQPQTQAI